MSGGRDRGVLVGGVGDVEDVVELHVDAGRRVKATSRAVGRSLENSRNALVKAAVPSRAA